MIKHISTVILLGTLTACQFWTIKSEPVSSPKAPTLHWSKQTPKKGTICRQQKGIYSLEKAYQIAINNCLLELADKQIQGAAVVKKTVSTQKNNSGNETSTTRSQVQNDFVVTTKNSDTLQYTLIEKHYDAAIETAYVWIELKK